MANYVLRRDGRDYQAPDLDTLRQWASDGRVLPTDMVFSPRYQSWYRARDLRELRDVLPLAEQSTPPPVARPPQQFWVRKGDRNYVADSLQTVLEWASNGNIGPDDLIYHPSYGKWFRAGDSPQLAGRFPPHIMGARMPYIAPGDDPLASGDFTGTGVDPNLNRNRPHTSPVGNRAARRSVVPRQRTRTGPVLIGNRKASGRGTRSGPFVMGANPTPQSLESADSTTATVTDFSVGDVARAIQARRESGAVSLAGSRRSTPPPDDKSVTEANPAVQPQTSIGDWGARDEQVFAPDDALARPTLETPQATTVDDAVEADGGVVDAKETAEFGDVAAAAAAPDAPSAPPQDITADEKPEPSEAPAPAAAEIPSALAAPAAPAEPETPETPSAPAAPAAEVGPSGLDAMYADIGPVDPEARFVDRLKMFKPFYAVAKVFLVTKDMRPGEVLETDARLPGHEFKGQDKRSIYIALWIYLVEQLNGKVKDQSALVADDEQEGFKAFLAAALHLVEVLERCDGIVGRKPPERFVVGNVNRPKMHPTEEALMVDLDTAFKSLIAVKAKSAAA